PALALAILGPTEAGLSRGQGRLVAQARGGSGWVALFPPAQSAG
ncbi:hypothetical protein AK812_SmicGene45994, partial [Symbiodinium microadriaticum]